MNDRNEKPTPATANKPIPATSTPTSSADSPKVTNANRTIHIVTNSKGGVGKTVVAWNLAQYLRDQGRALVAVDLDPMNHSLAEFHGLGARSVDLLTGDDMMSFNGTVVDRLIEDMLISENRADYVLDNGSSGFVSLTCYLRDNEFAGLLKERDGRLVVHAVLAGGAMSQTCLMGFNTLLEAFGKASGVQFVLWINEHFGPFDINGMGLKDMTFFQDMTAEKRLLGAVHMRQHNTFFLADFNRMHKAKLTYSEAIASPDFLTMNKQRLTLIQREVWRQLDALGVAA